MYLDNYISEIKKLCQANGVKTLYAFGSVLTDRFTEESDVDLVVDIDSGDPFEYTEMYFNLKFTLEDILKRKIDLLEAKAVKNSYFIQELEQTKALIYGR